jgi:hypothetical protein
VVETLFRELVRRATTDGRRLAPPAKGWRQIETLEQRVNQFVDQIGPRLPVRTTRSEMAASADNDSTVVVVTLWYDA